MSAAHTPGPWIVNELTRRGSPSNLYRWRITNEEGKDAESIAEIPTRYPYSEHFEADTDACNARLIAAAPELLAALEKAFMEMGRMGANHDLEHPCRLAWCLARDAIAKAVQS